MPHSPSAYKRMRSNEKKRERNLSTLSEIHSAKKTFRAALAADQAKAKETALALFSLVDTAASRGIIPKARASRVKSRASAALHKAQARNSQ